MSDKTQKTTTFCTSLSPCAASAPTASIPVSSIKEMQPDDAFALAAWYRNNKRSLPWRDTGCPEDVWLSEIMLQQTRVEAVKSYFVRFRNALPDAAAIAACSEDRLLKLWEGLGYYSRVRNIQKCARVLMEQYGGALPADEALLKKLPGIGPYTAGAIASIAFGIPVPAVDGNVLRVYARLTGCGSDIASDAVKRDFTEALSRLHLAIAGSTKAALCTPSELNQALMELGAVVCIPNGAPLCEICPLKDRCSAFRDSSTDRIPYKAPKKPRRIEDRTLLVIRDGERFLFRKRPSKGLLAGLWEFPGFEGSLSEDDALAAAKELGFEPLRIAPLPDAVHVFTHIEWHMKAYEVRIAEFEPGADAAGSSPFSEKAPASALITRAELKDFAVPSAFRVYKDYYALKADPEKS